MPRATTGRPKRLHLDAVLDAVLDIGLDTFTIAQLSGRLGVGEGTIYNYVRSRQELHGRAAARVLSVIDTDQLDVEDWTDYLIAVNDHLRRLCIAHPGVAAYYLHGPYRPDTIDYFDCAIAGVRRRLPGADTDLAFVLASHASTTTLSFLATADDDLFTRVLSETLTALEHALGGKAPAGISWDAIKSD